MSWCPNRARLPKRPRCLQRQEIQDQTINYVRNIGLGRDPRREGNYVDKSAPNTLKRPYPVRLQRFWTFRKFLVDLSSTIFE